MLTMTGTAYLTLVLLCVTTSHHVHTRSVTDTQLQNIQQQQQEQKQKPTNSQNEVSEIIEKQITEESADSTEEIPEIPDDLAFHLRTPCGYEPDAGFCIGSFPRWFFDTNLLRCRPFIFSGCAHTRIFICTQKYHSRDEANQKECEDKCDPIAVSRRPPCENVQCDPGMRCISLEDSKTVSCVPGW